MAATVRAVIEKLFPPLRVKCAIVVGCFFCDVMWQTKPHTTGFITEMVVTSFRINIMRNAVPDTRISGSSFHTQPWNIFAKKFPLTKRNPYV